MQQFWKISVRVHVMLSPDHWPFVTLNVVQVAIYELPLAEYPMAQPTVDVFESSVPYVPTMTELDTVAFGAEAQ